MATGHRVTTGVGHYPWPLWTTRCSLFGKQVKQRYIIATSQRLRRVRGRSRKTWALVMGMTDGFPSQRANNADVWCLFVLNLNKLRNKQSNCRWFEAPWRTCDRHCNVKNNSFFYFHGMTSPSYLLQSQTLCNQGYIHTVVHGIHPAANMLGNNHPRHVKF